MWFFGVLGVFLFWGFVFWGGALLRGLGFLWDFFVLGFFFVCSFLWYFNFSVFSCTWGHFWGPPQFPSHMNCPTELLFGGRRELFPLPPPSEPLNFPHSTGLRYEAQHVRECLLQGEQIPGILGENPGILGVPVTADPPGAPQD